MAYGLWGLIEKETPKERENGKFESGLCTNGCVRSFLGELARAPCLGLEFRLACAVSAATGRWESIGAGEQLFVIACI